MAQISDEEKFEDHSKQSTLGPSSSNSELSVSNLDTSAGKGLRNDLLNIKKFYDSIMNPTVFPNRDQKFYYLIKIISCNCLVISFDLNIS